MRGWRSGLAALALLAGTGGVEAAPARILCTLAVAADSGATLVEEGEGCDGAVTPASTFKVALALMGYDAGILVDAHDPDLPFKEGYVDWRKAWRQPTDPARWMAESVVWYSQRLTESLGRERFQAYVDAFAYGNRDLSGDPGTANGLTNAWLSSSLRISPRQQIAFLRALVGRTLPVAAGAYGETARITDLGSRGAGWRIHGKTGSGLPRGADGTMVRGRAYGWFVGWAEREGRTVVFARLIQDQGKGEGPAGFRARDGLLADLFEGAGAL
jgi:beta-lactamase class D